VSPARHVRTIGIIATVLAVVVVGLVVFLATRTPSQATAFSSPLIGRPAPTTTGETLQGTSVDLARAKGRVVVVNFFASWCPPCQSEAPQLNAFAYDQSKKADGAQMVGVIFNDSNAAARNFVLSYGVDYPVVIDSHGNIANAWGVASPPTTYLIGPDGRVAMAYLGPLTAAQLDADVTKIMAGKA
jgi:cytochrome c biogenesis protein CcmG, thiol:disulfide interchange protein DsbE